MINDFHKEYFFLSNFAPSVLYYEGVRYPTVEHAFQAAKMVHDSDKQAISVAQSPGEAKRIGRRGLMRSDWEDIKVDVMRKCLMRKFLLNPEVKNFYDFKPEDVVLEGYRFGEQIRNIPIAI